MKIAVFCALGALVAFLIAMGLVTRIRYRVGSSHVKVLLFGMCLRRIALSNIDSISKRRGDGWAEHWRSTSRAKHRMLVIRKKRGLLRNFIITPKNRYIFKTEVERAMRRAGLTVVQSRGELSDSEVSPPEDMANPGEKVGARDGDTTP